MEPQAEPAELFWLHGRARNEASTVFWLHDGATNEASNETTIRARTAVFKPKYKTGLKLTTANLGMIQYSTRPEGIEGDIRGQKTCCALDLCS